MPLQDYISGNQDDQRDEVATFLFDRWQEVLDEEPVFRLRCELESPVWTGDRFEIGDVEVGTEIRAQLSFVAKGLDEKSRLTGEKVTGSAVVIIDQFDGLSFTNVEVES
jgi:hypothetical protein